MAASTTLITFRVRTPAITRSVDLYGSWDNFTIPYSMSRDIRLGAEHWSGCHSFENIICDGNVNDSGLVRHGGLKMGGTYWYYYKLDDEIEFHNSAEPATTRCPLLPGQLINELQMPFTLSGSRRRDASVSSTSSERRTLDPEDKYVNPRPVPNPPMLLRLKSSPTLPLLPSTGSNSYPHSVATTPTTNTASEEMPCEGSSRIFHLPKVPSLDCLLKAGSTRKNPASLRKPMAMPLSDSAARQDKTYQDIIDWIPGRPADVQSPGSAAAPSTASPQQPSRRPAPGALLLRSNSEEAVPLASFREHRRQQSRSRSRGETPRNPMVHNAASRLVLGAKAHENKGPLSALMEVSTPKSTPGYGPMTGRRIALEALEGRNEAGAEVEKRLPTLPNTPSSVYPPTTATGNSPPRHVSTQIPNWNSHFSASTIDTTYRPDSTVLDAEQHSYIANPDAVAQLLSESPRNVMTENYFDFGFELSTFDTTIATDGQADETAHEPRIMSSTVVCTAIGSTVSSTPTTSYGENESMNSSRFSCASSIDSSREVDNNFQHYSLPEIEHASEVTIKQYHSREGTLTDCKDSQRSEEDFSHSESMQQLLDELSYLSSLIQH